MIYYVFFSITLCILAMLDILLTYYRFSEDKRHGINELKLEFNAFPRWLMKTFGINAESFLMHSIINISIFLLLTRFGGIYSILMINGMLIMLNYDHYSSIRLNNINNDNVMYWYNKYQYIKSIKWQ